MRPRTIAAPIAITPRKTPRDVSGFAGSGAVAGPLDAALDCTAVAEDAVVPADICSETASPRNNVVPAAGACATMRPGASALTISLRLTLNSDSERAASV